MSTPATHAVAPARRGRGFTLVEVMISIALVLVVILGINQVFGLTSQAVGAGQALGTATRDGRTTQSVIYRDLSNVEIERAPFFLINSEAYAAFRNREDQLADKDYDVTNTGLVATDNAVRTLDRDGNGSDADDGDKTPRFFMTTRTHRADQLIFFARNRARRQTGDANTFTSTIGSNQQYISYGHLRQPDQNFGTNDGQMPGMISPLGDAPTTPTNNPNNFYATQWVLGRNAFVMREPETLPSGQKVIYENPGSTQTQATYYGPAATATDPPFSPFEEGAKPTKNGTPLPSPNGNDIEIERSHFDLVGIGMDRFRDVVMPAGIVAPPALAGLAWHDRLVFRYRGYPYPNKPLTSVGVARTVPCFVNHCTQFAVEFAGDFLDQRSANGNGDPIDVCKPDGTGTDGEVDYILQKYTFNGVPQTSRRIRWYGFPRDTHGALGTPGVPDVANAIKPDGHIYWQDDVVPLRDVLAAQLPTAPPVNFQKVLPALPPVNSNAGTPRPGERDYGNPLASPDPSLIAPVPGTTNGNPKYRCLWSPEDTTVAGLPKPRMVRITMAVDDPAGRIASEQFFEYIVELPQ